ncbi:DUF4402 domain-containing protein [Qipengyuania seohaensis]|uniref:DUF4402 domain-containing protein n=1 Tax=Qipengyuania seohaensis TaxID=266951 RepID=UPI000C223BE7|nr:DUF4402 domain-containing protein [Qipengyuania seohaensis]
MGMSRFNLARGRTAISAACALMCMFAASPAASNRPQVSVQNPAALRFGTFAVPTSGFREVSPRGGISSGGIFALDDTGVGPAQFVVQYDRGNNGRRELNLVIEIVFSAPGTYAQGGLTARLSRYQIDLPGYGAVQPGQVIRIELPNCRQRVCSRSFNLGGRIDVDRNFGGGLVEIPIIVDAAVISVK